LKFIGPKGQKIIWSANNVGNADPHVRQAFLNDVFTFLTEVGNEGRIVNTNIAILLKRKTVPVKKMICLHFADLQLINCLIHV
jgi:hypothetical protein